MERIPFEELSVWLRDTLEDSDFEEENIIDITDFYEPSENDIKTGIYITFKNGQKLKITIEDITKNRKWKWKKYINYKEANMYNLTWTLADGKLFVIVSKFGKKYKFVGEKEEILKKLHNIVSETDYFRFLLLFN